MNIAHSHKFDSGKLKTNRPVIFNERIRHLTRYFVYL